MNRLLLLLFFCVSVFFSFAQNVGIGTTTPLSKLHVAGAIRSDTLIYVGPGVRSLFAAPNGRIYDSLVIPSTINWQINGNSNVTAIHFLGTTNANDVIFKTNNVEHARILSGGGMGVETATLDFASTRFQVNGGHILSGDGGGVVFKDPTAGVGLKYWQFRTSNLTAGNFVIKTLDDLGVTQLDVIAMTRAGNVGIGVTLPDYKLHVNINEPTVFSAANNATWFGSKVQNVNAASGTAAGMTLRSNTFDAGIFAITDGTANGGRLAFVGDNPQTESMTIWQNNVGIGTTAPANKLEITSAAANTSGLRFTNLTAASTTVATNGKALSVDANGDVILVSSASNAWQLLGNGGTTPATNFLGTTDAQDLAIRTNNTEKVRVLSSGNVGIGTTTPGQLLHVNGNTLANEFWIFSGAGDLKIHNAGIANTMVFNTSGLERMRINNNGLVGINTTAPTSRLEVGAIGGDGITLKATAGTDVGDIMFFDAAGVEKGRVYTNPLAAPGLIFSGSSTPAAHMFIDNLGNVGIGNSSPANRVHITSAAANTSGLRFANLTSASPTVATNGKALSVDANGDVILVSSASNAWALLGNAGTTAGTNFLGTTDAQDLVFKTNAAEQARILTNGFFGIGIASPTERLHVNGNVQIGPTLGVNATGNYLTFSDPGNNTDVLTLFRTNGITDQSDLNVSIGDNYGQNAGIDRFKVGAYGGGNFNSIFTVTSEGRVGIGQNSPAALFHITKPVVDLNPVVLYESGPMVFGAYINTTHVGYTNPAGILYWELGGAESYMFGGEILPDADAQWNLGAGIKRWNTLFATNGTINTSDARLKKDVAQLSYGLKDILKLTPVEYNWKDASIKTYGSGKNLGFLAQDLEKVIPNVVYTPKDEKDHYGVNYEALIPVLTKSIQELNEKLETKTADLKTLTESYQAQIDELKKMVEALKKQ